MNEPPHNGWNDKDCPQCGQGWKERKYTNKLREILENLIKHQKIACSPNCIAKGGMELQSIEKAISKLNSYYKSRLPTKKVYDKKKNNLYVQYYLQGFNDAIIRAERTLVVVRKELK